MENLGINVNNMVYAGISTSNVIRALSQSGVAWTRFNLYWGWIETKEGVYDWQPVDEALSALAAAHIHVLLTLDGPVPCWAGNSCTPWTAPTWTVPPADAWASFVTAAVNRYKGQVEYWEIWNEPDRTIDLPDSTERIIQYRDNILIPGAAAVHQQDAAARVVGPTFASNTPGGTATGPELQAALSLVLSGAGGSSIDIVSLHSYYPDDAIGKVPGVEGALAERSLAKKPIWITEDGLDGSDLSNSDTAGVENAQADFLRQEVQRTITPQGVDKIFWFALTDSRASTTSNVHSDDFGVIDNQDYVTYDWTPRAAFESLQHIAAQACSR